MMIESSQSLITKTRGSNCNQVAKLLTKNFSNSELSSDFKSSLPISHTIQIKFDIQ